MLSTWPSTVNPGISSLEQEGTGPNSLARAGTPFRDTISCDARETTIEHRQEPRQEILRAAARLFQQQGYDATSMNDVAAALKLSKGGLYHHFQSKDEILYNIISHAMDITEERVINVVRRIDAVSVAGSRVDVTEERLRTLIRLHIQVVLSPEDREITVMLHETHPSRQRSAARSMDAKRIICTSSRT